MIKITKQQALVIMWIQSWVATVGSLYFSEIMKLPPCILCWYQRLCMYPLVVIFFVGIMLRDKNAFLYALPLTIVGWILAFYHSLLYYGILPESAAPCTEGISCTTELILIFGFISIPLMSLAAFSVILVGIIIGIRNKED